MHIQKQKDKLFLPLRYSKTLAVLRVIKRPFKSDINYACSKK